jgi:hypothetical protein
LKRKNRVEEFNAEFAENAEDAEKKEERNVREAGSEEPTLTNQGWGTLKFI